SSCGYSTGVGWRQIVENLHMVATTRDWFAQKGRHRIYAGNRPIPLPNHLKRQLPVVSGNGNGAAAGGGCGSGCGGAHGASSGQTHERREEEPVGAGTR